MFKNAFKGKKIVITGHTGFKGSWLTAWLNVLGAEIVGISFDIPTVPSHFKSANLDLKIEDKRIDVRDKTSLDLAIQEVQPDYLFHLAAQPLVRQSYSNPVETYETNVLGTLNVLEALRKLEKKCSAVFITSDKCYDNVEWEWGYRENDALGGPDPYSASKGAAEIVIRSHKKSYFSSALSEVRIASARAGNVIGGGDWADDRVVPDCVRSWSKGGIVQLRNPKSTRPWQHVLEPLSGYLSLAVSLYESEELHGESFNFGPPAHQNQSVEELVNEMAKHWDEVRWEDVSDKNDGPYESGLLKLNCDKALHRLHWCASMGFEDTVRMTSEWFRTYYKDPSQVGAMTDSQILQYTTIAKSLGLAAWAQ